jgi:hypothetical protein
MEQNQAPPQAYDDCRGNKAGDTVQHTTPDGAVPATCADSPEGLVARPNRRPGDRPDDRRNDRQDGQTGNRTSPERPRQESRGSGDNRYSIEQAVSDRAQLATIAFDGLAFLAGDKACSTFLPPGKAADFSGFQYTRDVDTNELGHSTSVRAAGSAGLDREALHGRPLRGRRPAELPDQIDQRSMSHTAHVVVMTYPSELFSWYAGSVEAGGYFCPGRHAGDSVPGSRGTIGIAAGNSL